MAVREGPDLYWIVRNEAVRSILVNSHISYNSILSGSTGGTWFVGNIICYHHLSYRYYMLTFGICYPLVISKNYKHMSCWHPIFIFFLTDLYFSLTMQSVLDKLGVECCSPSDIRYSLSERTQHIFTWKITIPIWTFPFF